MPFRYLGVPLASKKLSVNQLMPLIEKITAKVTCLSSKRKFRSGIRLKVDPQGSTMKRKTNFVIMFPLREGAIGVEVNTNLQLYGIKPKLTRAGLLEWQKACGCRVAGADKPPRSGQRLS
ncbi:hypothetical protein H5410_041691 [Solanum commersonii]|uniref:Uncharacterized protein n=1 Tax=Solanum commersonii TaxID=4109 RepID=A0A9J5XSL2_SOLCO|nr:hypothetical protein H5410_041691 [Solanum commersonii]